MLERDGAVYIIKRKQFLKKLMMYMKNEGSHLHYSSTIGYNKKVIDDILNFCNGYNYNISNKKLNVNYNDTSDKFVITGHIFSRLFITNINITISGYKYEIKIGDELPYQS